ncbi:MAG: ABC transporter permease [Tissierellia bacterium]|nr:ABC transporter permease [Tissierellia bacterium]
MNNLIRNIIYQGKNTLRDYGFSFWSVIYPLILAMFFNIAFSGMMNMELENIDVGILDGNPIEQVLEEIEFINIHKIHEGQKIEKLDSEEIHGFIDEDLNLIVKKSGVNETIIKEIIEQIKQMQKLNRPFENYDFEADYIVDRNQMASSIIVVFYSLIAMFSTYGVSAGIATVSLIQANLSNIGARISITPLKKKNFLFAGILVSLFLNLAANGLLLLFVKYILKIDLLKNIKYSIILIIIGNLFGVSLGMFIGASNKKSMNTKILIGVASTLFLSFLSGMMGPWMKVVIDEHIPILARINPISIISNNLYRINLLQSNKTLGEGIVFLSIYCLLLIFSSYIFLRRKSYDSL